MTRLSVFNSPLLLGFEHFERALDRVSKTASDGYPPYNVEQVAEDHLRITLAVAGFKADDLEVRVEDTQLTIRGRHEDERERVYLHRGIASRQFQRSFVLSEGIEVAGAALDNGLLHIDLVRRRPEPQVRTIEIKSGRRTREEIATQEAGRAGERVAETAAADGDPARSGRGRKNSGNHQRK
jgi:HSP20 family molecular chaperone IbpA